MDNTLPRWITVVLCGVCCLLWGQSALAASKYLNPATGSDAAAGGSTTPWKTFYKAIGKTCGAGTSACLAPGDELIIRPGTYTATQYRNAAGILDWNQTQSLGTAGNPITIRCETPTGCTLDGQLQTYWIKFTANIASYPGHYVIVKDIKFINYRGVAMGIVGGSNANVVHHIAQINTVNENFSQNLTGASVVMNAHHIVLRGNRYTNIGTPAHPVGSGTPSQQHAVYTTEETDDVVVEGMWAEKVSGTCGHYYGHNTMTPTNRQQIYRRNVCVNPHSSHFILVGGRFDKFYYYHNTGYSEVVPYSQIDGVTGYASWDSHLSVKELTNIRILNNIMDGFFTAGAMVMNSSATAFTSSVLNYNLFRNQTNGNNIYNWDGVAYNLAGFQAATPYQDNGKDTNPGFVSVPNKNFTLAAGSSAIDAGRVLTTTVGAGSGATALVVTDAGFFFDGYGLVTGDTVCINNANPTVLSAVNYTTNTLTLATPQTWSSGQSVGPCYAGSAPDLGAFETPLQLLAFTTQPVSATLNTPMADILVTAKDGEGDTITAFTGVITLAKATGAGTFTCADLTVNAVAGVATFADCAVDVVSTYTLRATAPSYIDAVSDQFNGTAVPVVVGTTPPTVVMRGN